MAQVEKCVNLLLDQFLWLCWGFSDARYGLTAHLNNSVLYITRPVPLSHSQAWALAGCARWGLKIVIERIFKIDPLVVILAQQTKQK